MPVAEITVKYVNQPKAGKKMGSIKTTGDEYYNVWPDKLGLFQAGQNYTVEYTVNDQGFKTFKQMGNSSGAQAIGSTAAVGNMAQARAAGHAAQRGGDAKAEEMFVMGFMNRCYQGNNGVPPHSQLVAEMRTLRSAWQEVWAPAPMPSAARQSVVPDDLNDDIPF